jgi:hypothetical protein
MGVSRRVLFTGGAALAWTQRDWLRPQRRPHSSASVCSTREAALQMISDNGFCVLQDWVPREHIHSCFATEAGRSLPRDVADPRPGTWRESAFGRYHQKIFSQEDTIALAEVERPLLPLVRAFFTEVPGEEQPFYRSELQLLTAVPESERQIWHSDNRSRGLTLLIPLVDFSIENGGTQLLPGSHQPLATPLTGSVVACAPAGSVLVYDARTYHRGLGNSTSVPRPALVLRYDSPDTPPPGVGNVSAAAHACVADALHLMGGAWTAVGLAMGLAT